MAMDLLSATHSLYFPATRSGDGKQAKDSAAEFLDALGGGGAPELSSLPVEKTQLDGLPVEPSPELTDPPETPEEPYVDPQILLTQKLAASLIGGWRAFDPPAAAA